jgi:hypothetical protein
VINNLDRQFLACVGIRIDDDILACVQTPQPLPLPQPREREPREPQEPQEPMEEHGIVEAALKEQLRQKCLRGEIPSASSCSGWNLVFWLERGVLNSPDINFLLLSPWDILFLQQQGILAASDYEIWNRARGSSARTRRHHAD